MDLQHYFGNLISFMNEMDKEKEPERVDSGKSELIADSCEALFEKVAVEFNFTWKSHLQNLNASVIQSFPNFQNGARIFHAMVH